MLALPVIIHAEGISIEDLQVKNSPAFVGIGVEPTTVQKPSSAKAFGIALASALENSDSTGSALANIAIESSPYWWFGGETLTLENFYDSKNPLKNALRTFTLSLATKDKRIAPESGDTSGSSLGVGFRAKFLMGNRSAESKTRLQKLKDAMYGAIGQIPSSEWDNFDKIPPGRQTIEKTTAAPVAADVLKTMKLESAALRESLKNPDGFQLEGAGSAGFESDEKNLSSPKLKRWGAWANASYRAPPTGGSFISSIDIITMARYLRTKSATDKNFDAFDIGGKLFWSKRDQPLAASVEYIYRFHSNQDSKKFAVMLEYMITETTSVYITNGKDFGDDTTGKRESFSYFGLNFSVGSGGKAKLQ